MVGVGRGADLVTYVLDHRDLVRARALLHEVRRAAAQAHRHDARGRDPARRPRRGTGRSKSTRRARALIMSRSHGCRPPAVVDRAASENRSPLSPRWLAAARHDHRARPGAADQAADVRQEGAVRPALRGRQRRVARRLPARVRHHALRDAARGRARAHRVRARRGRAPQAFRALPPRFATRRCCTCATGCGGTGRRGGAARVARREARARHTATV